MKKIYVNRRPVIGPWGGGNKTLALLCKQIIQSDYILTHNLEPDIDLIFCFDPRPDDSGIWYKDFVDYKIKNKNCKIVQRVGDVGSHSKPELTMLLKEIVNNALTDFYIFPSSWARKIINHTSDNFKIIQNRPLSLFFNNRSEYFELNKQKVKIVTHHWSMNEKKGFEFYDKLGKYFSKNKLGNHNVELTYIGRYNKLYSSSGINIIDPVDNVELAKMLPEHDIYMTASIEEAGANHVLEAMAAGLPVVYDQRGGSINEYCNRFGLEYKGIADFLNKLSKMIDNFKYYKEQTLLYDQKIDLSISEYMNRIQICLECKK